MSVQILSQKSLLIIFAYAPTGLGHLRVTKALHEGLSEKVDSLLLSSHDAAINTLHRLTSIHPVMRNLLEISQRGVVEDIVAFSYRTFLRNNTDTIYEQLNTIVDQRLHVPKTILIIATHNSLAHQLAAVKEKLARSKQVQVLLIVQVTDDSPQHLWYVPGADLTFVPSERTKQDLAQYGRVSKLPLLQYQVSAYPLSPILSRRLKNFEHQDRQDQLTISSKSYIHLAVPVSGAAVGTTFISDILKALRTFTSRFRFHTISKRASYTEIFLNQMFEYKDVQVYASNHDRDVVDQYDELYAKRIIGLEITKPSEQAFKALVSPRRRGGSLLLFSAPVGRQEYDNIFFLRRHNLIPTASEQTRLWEFADLDKSLSQSEGKQLLNESLHWRGVRLPENAVTAAHFIWWCLKEGIFTQMARWIKTPRNEANHAHELAADGTKRFWAAAADFVTSQNV